VNERICKSAILNFTSCRVRQYKYSRITYYSYLIPEIRDLQHTQITPDLLKYLATKRKEYRAWNAEAFDDKRKIEAEK
jgi:hypothetical protein